MTWTVNDLGFLPGGTFSIAQAASSDGSVIVGVADTGADPGNGHAFRWTSAGGMVDLGVLLGGTSSIAYGVSGDGSIVVGASDGGASADNNTEAFRWTSGTGMVGLGFLGTGTGSGAYGISNDGVWIVGVTSIVPGNVLGLPAYSFRWTIGLGMLNLFFLPGNSDMIALAISADGSKIGGGPNQNPNRPWQWTFGPGIVAFPLAAGQAYGQVQGFSANGLAAAGSSSAIASSNSNAFYWTQAGGVTLIGFLGTGNSSEGTSISGDGSIAVGFSNDGVSAFNQPFIYTVADGMVALPGLNVSASGGSAWGISQDGAIIVGDSRGNELEPVLHAVYWSQSTPPPPPGPPILSQPVPQSLGRWRGQVGINWNGLALVGDAFSNVVGLANFSQFNEYGNVMQMLITTPPLHDDRKRIFVNRFEIEMEAGEGLPNDPETAPQIMLDYSKDGGKTFANLQQFRSMGKVGEYIKRLRWINMGNARTWIFRLRYTDGARPAIIGSYWSGYKGLG